MLNKLKNTGFKILMISLFAVVDAYGQSNCPTCPKGMTAPSSVSSPLQGFNGYTSEVRIFDGTTPTCYTPTANTLNGHLQGINNKLCSIKSTLDSLRSYDANNTIRLDSIINAIDTNTADIDVRLDSIITALGQFYNTNIVSSDSSIHITSTVVGEVIKFDLSVVNDSLEIDSGNGLSGNGRALTPVKLGGTLTENTTITGDKDFNLNIRDLSLYNTYDTIKYGILSTVYTSKMSKPADFSSDDIGVKIKTVRDVRNGTWSLSSYSINPTSTALVTDIKMTSGASLIKTGDTSGIPGWGDVTNVGMGYEAQNTTGGHITSVVNLGLYAIYKGSNTLPCTIYRYTSLALGDLNRDTSRWIVPTERYAIYQEGETDRNQFNGIMILPNLTVYANDAAAAADTNLPSGGFYLITGSTVLHVKP